MTYGEGGMINSADNIQNKFSGSVVAVVVTYNRKKLLKESVQALVAQNNSRLKILIVDNASTDGTYDFISDIIDDARIFYKNTGENLGGAGGFNFGIKEAVKLGCDYVWLMDDDCIVGGNALEALLEYANSLGGDFGFLSSVVRWRDGEICKMNVQRKSIARSVDFSNGNQQIMFASFVSLFLNVKAVEVCGLPIKEFFIWGDDLEYTSRISKSFKNYLVINSEVVHKSDSNICVIMNDETDRLDRYFYAYRNERYLYSHLGLKGRVYYFAKLCYHRLRIVLSKSPRKTEKLAVIKKGLKAAKTFNPQIEFLN